MYPYLLKVPVYETFMIVLTFVFVSHTDIVFTYTLERRHEFGIARDFLSILIHYPTYL